MSNDIPLGLPIVGPGSQPDTEGVEYLPMPSEMNTFRPPILPEADEVAHLAGARAVMEQLDTVLSSYRIEQPPVRLPLDDLDADNLKLIAQTLGEGEVKIMAQGAQTVHIQESVMAGIWQVQRLNAQGAITAHWLEVGAVPSVVRTIMQTETPEQLTLGELPPNLMNAPAILTEVAEHQAKCQEGAPPHVINLTLLPISEEDQTCLLEMLGSGPITVLSKGYGNCRISSANLNHTWWVRYYNSMDRLILNTLEIVDVPQVAQAAQEDIEDSAKRLHDLLTEYLHWG